MKIDSLTIATIEALQREADEKDMVVDWETATLVSRKYQHMNPHQRDFVAKQETFRQHYNDLNNSKDNDPASPEQAWDEER